MYILVRYGEIALKSPSVRRQMEQRLVRNISRALKRHSVKATVRRSYGRLLVTSSSNALPILQHVFGVVSVSPAVRCPATLDAIPAAALKLAKKHRFRTFAVKAKRVGTHPFTSQDINVQVGDAIRTTLKKKVDLGSPDLTLWIEVRDRQAFLYTEKLPGQGGLPLGSQGTVAALLDNADDLLAAWFLMRRGCSVIPVTTKPRLVSQLEAWAFHPLKPLTLEQALRKGALGIVTGAFKKTDPLLSSTVPTYTPLLGVLPPEQKRFSRALRDWYETTRGSKRRTKH